MKKILFLLLICFIKLNAYEYLIYENLNASVQSYARFQFYTDEHGYLQVKRENVSGEVIYQNKTNAWYNIFNNIKLGYSGYINSNKLKDYYSSDLLFLNDLYSQSLNMFLNFLYNSNDFSSTNYIEYNEYQILYNEDGLAVESIVGGVWKGLYDTPENSGLLYDKANNILYDNGQVASLFQRFWFSLTGNVSKTLKLYYISILSLNLFILILAVYLVKVLLGLIIKWITTVINNTKVNVNLGAQKRW